MKGFKDQIIDLHVNQGINPKRIAEKLGISFQPVYLFLHEQGLYRKTTTGGKRRYQVDETYFDAIDSENKAYALGFIVADGYVDEELNRIVIALHAKDEDILVKIRKVMSSTHPIRTELKKNQRILSINSAILVRALSSKGVCQGKSKTMTDEVWSHVPEEFKRDFLRGYFDGDGCMTLGAKYSSGVKYLIQIIGTEKFLTGTYQKWYPSTCKLHAYKSCDMHAWKLSSKAAVLDFLGKLYDGSSIYLDRKHDTYRNALM